MQDYLDHAIKNGVLLFNTGSCQFCGAATKRGVHECVEIFSLGFQQIDYSKVENHIYRFLSVDAHTLQHPEIHGRWNNHFHLTRLHLILRDQVKWSYNLSPKLSDHLNKYKAQNKDEVLDPPAVLQRGSITTTDVAEHSTNEDDCKKMIRAWGSEVHKTWSKHHSKVDAIADGFLIQMEL